MSYNPWRDAALRHPRIHIESDDIAPAHAAWHPELRILLVGTSITRAERRCALAHEIAHIDLDDRPIPRVPSHPTGLCWFDRRQESTADRLAARRLVELGDLVEVLRWCRDPREVAAELDVTLDVLAMRGSMLHPAERGKIDATLELVLGCRDLAA